MFTIKRELHVVGVTQITTIFGNGVAVYNLETVLAEKFETIITRNLTTTRMRDFYDIFILTTTQTYDLRFAYTTRNVAFSDYAISASGELFFIFLAHVSETIARWKMKSECFYIDNIGDCFRKESTCSC